MHGLVTLCLTFLNSGYQFGPKDLLNGRISTCLVHIIANCVELLLPILMYLYCFSYVLDNIWSQLSKSALHQQLQWLQLWQLERKIQLRAVRNNSNKIPNSSYIINAKGSISPIRMVLSTCCLLPILAVVGETVTVVEAVVVDSVLSPEQTNI